jgi:hypothetical protein
MTTKFQKIEHAKVEKIGREEVAAIASESFAECDWIEKAKIVGASIADRVLDETELIAFPAIKQSEAFVRIAREAFDARLNERYEAE